MQKKEIIAQLASEGNFSIYKKKAGSARFVFFLKLLVLMVSLKISFNKKNINNSIVYIKGTNQYRIYKNLKDKIIQESGEHTILIQPDLLWRDSLFNSHCRVNIDFKDFASLFSFAFLYLLSNKIVYIQRFLYAYYVAIEKFKNKFIGSVDKFYCFNDQPFECSAFILAMQKQAKTITIQHGEVIRKEFYFPSKTDEFWAWGSRTKKLFESIPSNTNIIIKGRFSSDAGQKKTAAAPKNINSIKSILITPSYDWQQIIESCITCMKLAESHRNIEICMKLHPSTKFISYFYLFCLIKKIKLIPTSRDMLELPLEFDCIFTQNSTSALDFLLHNKRIIIGPKKIIPDFLNDQICVSAEDLIHASINGTEFYDNLDHYASARKEVLSACLNV